MQRGLHPELERIVQRVLPFDEARRAGATPAPPSVAADAAPAAAAAAAAHHVAHAHAPPRGPRRPAGAPPVSSKKRVLGRSHARADEKHAPIAVWFATFATADYLPGSLLLLDLSNCSSPFASWLTPLPFGNIHRV